LGRTDFTPTVIRYPSSLISVITEKLLTIAFTDINIQFDLVATAYSGGLMADDNKKSSPQNFWEYWNCDQNKRKLCPPFIRNRGKDCWVFTNCNHPFTKRGFRHCTSCPWYQDLNQSFTKDMGYDI
jgi:hypothetical protein